MSGIIAKINRVEKKMDRILELLEGKELSITMNAKEVSETVLSEIERRKEASRLF